MNRSNLKLALALSLVGNLAFTLVLIAATRDDRQSRAAMHNARTALFTLCNLAPEIRIGMGREEIAGLAKKKTDLRVTLRADRVSVDGLEFHLDPWGGLVRVQPDPRFLVAGRAPQP